MPNLAVSAASGWLKIDWFTRIITVAGIKKERVACRRLKKRNQVMKWLFDIN